MNPTDMHQTTDQTPTESTATAPISPQSQGKPAAPSPLFPLPDGGRPAFGGKRWLQALHLHAHAGLAGRAVSASEAMAFAWTLRAWAGAIRLNARQGFTFKETASATVKSWRDLPVLLPPHFVRWWEQGQPWKSLAIRIDTLAAYQAVLDGPEPSMGYEPESDTTTSFIWESHLKTAEPHALCEMLDLAANLWEGWALSHPHLDRCREGLARVVQLGLDMGLSHEQSQLWAQLELWLSLASHAIPYCMDALVDRVGSQANLLFSILGEAFGVEATAFFDLFAGDSPLVRKKVYAALLPNGNGWQLPGGRAHDVKGLMLEWAQPAWIRARSGLAGKGLLDWSSFLKTLSPETSFPMPTDGSSGKVSEANDSVKPSPSGDAIALKAGFETQGDVSPPPAPAGLPALTTYGEDWMHLGDEFANAVAALTAKGSAPLILVTGPRGEGKTKLCLDLAKAAGRIPVAAIVQNNAAAETLRMAMWACAQTPQALLILDDADALMEDESIALLLNEPRSTAMLVAVKDFTRFHSLARERFTKIIFLEKMTLPVRRKLAQRHFADEALALRAARALQSPRAIVDAAAWCQATGQWTWATIKAHQGAAERAAAATGWDKKRFDLEPTTTLADLPPMAGNAHLVELANRLTLAFENPDAYAALGGSPPKGAILLGPPGTGKTLFARHLAARLDAPLIAPDTAGLHEYPDRIAELFQFARQHAPCVVLLDEAEKIICVDPRFPIQPSLTALLAQLDGVEPLEGVLVIATTNNPQLSPPLQRSGRLSEVRTVSAPFQADREAMWRAYLKGKPLAEPMDAAVIALARSSRGLTGADIAETLRRAAGEAVVHGEPHLSLARLIRACDDVRWDAGDGQDPVCDRERWATAVHESGHALLAWRWNLEVLRITVRSRNGSLGMVQWDHQERSYDASRRMAFGRLQMILGGIAAEQALLGAYGSGGSCDLANAQRLLNSHLAGAGFGGMGPVGSGNISHWSDQRRRQVEMESEVWAREAFEEAVTWLGMHRHLVEALARELLEKWDLSSHELDAHKTATQNVAEPRPEPPVPTRLMELNERGFSLATAEPAAVAADPMRVHTGAPGPEEANFRLEQKSS